MTDDSLSKTVDDSLGEEKELLALRRARLTALRAAGNAFPNDFRRQHLAQELHDLFDSQTKEALETSPTETAVAGRVMLRRIMGKASFVTLQDVSGAIQLYVRQGDIGDAAYNAFKHWDLGDIVGVVGKLMKTDKDELTVRVSEARLLTKALRPLPGKHKGLADTETRYRQPYLDLMMNDASRHLFIKRSQLIDALRRFLVERDFMEVETPMMQTTPGGATAAPFITHYKALDLDMYLRVAPELNLKRLVVGGFERVFEINRNFRNEGISAKHSPEFTMLEFYCAYADYQDLMDFTEVMLRSLAMTVLGTTELVYNNTRIDLAQPFVRMTMHAAIIAFNPQVESAELTDPGRARALAERSGIEVQPDWGLGRVVMALFEALVEERIEAPHFITQHPTEVSPLARRNDDNPEVTDRFELFVMGREIANGFSELNDAEDQATRFQAQAHARQAGDTEAMHYDEDYITALEYGLPPTAGEGLGIDRLVMLFTDAQSIRDVMLFPLMRPKR